MLYLLSVLCDFAVLIITAAFFYCLVLSEFKGDVEAYCGWHIMFNLHIMTTPLAVFLGYIVNKVAFSLAISLGTVVLLLIGLLLIPFLADKYFDKRLAEKELEMELEEERTTYRSKEIEELKKKYDGIKVGTTGDLWNK